ncbi:sushi domain-containing protein 2-like isoform X2 [Dysidea avara]
MNIGPNSSRAAVIIFDDSASVRFNLNQYTDSSSLISAIRNIPYYAGGTDIPAALNMLRNSALNGALGIRNTSRQIAIFLTDGEGGNIAPAAEALAETNIFEVFTVGVGSARVDQLNLISQTAELVYYHSVFTEDSLATIAQEIARRLKVRFIVIQPRYGNILGGTVIQVIGSNIEFYEHHIYQCHFDGTEVPGAYVASLGHVICISPSLRDQGTVNFCLSISSPLSTSQHCTQYYSLVDEDSTEVIYDNITLSTGDDIMIHWSPDSIFPQSLKEPLFGAETFKVDISLYMLDSNNENYSFVAKLASDVTNTGMYQVTVQELSMIEDYAAGVIGVSLSEQFAGRTKRGITDIIDTIVRNAIKYGPMLLIAEYVDPQYTRSACELWALAESVRGDIGSQILNRVPPCPPNRELALKDDNFDEEGFLSIIFHTFADSCFKQRDFTPENQGSGQQCCYDKQGGLLIGPDSGGTVDLYSNKLHFWKHTIFDVAPFILCCRTLRANCQAYYDKRPSDDGSRYSARRCARASGDPHIITLDGLKYTFNGRGEFVLIEHVDDVFELQGRMVNLIGQQMISATVFSAVVGKQNDSDAVQFDINQQFNGIDVIVGGELIDMEGLYEISFSNVKVFNLGRNAYAARFSSGCFIQVKEENGFISVLTVALPDSFKGYTRGLMGNYNGDMTDDLVARNSTSPLHHNASLYDIHYQFGITWYTSNTSSLFTYNKRIGQNWESFYDPDYVPLFSFNTNDPVLESVCDNDMFCMFDVASTGNTEIGLSTLNSSKEYEVLLELSYPIVCEPPCVQGACVANDTCNCVMGYVGERCNEAVYEDCGTDFEVCANGGVCRKLGTSYICECPDGFTGLSCQSEIHDDDDGDDDNSQLVIIVVSLIAALALLILLALAVFFCYHKRKRKYYV